MISSSHQASLKSRAITVHAAEAAEIRSAQPSEIADMLGVSHVPAPGILIPYLEAAGTPVIGEDGLEIVRVRYDGDIKPKYASRGGSGFSVYLPPLIRSQISQAARDDVPNLQAGFIVITEGEFKALAVETALGIPAIGLPGVTMYLDPTRDKSIPATSSTPLHPHLAAVLARARGVLVIADSDAAEKLQVRSAMTALREAISKQFEIPTAYAEVPGPKRVRGRPKKEDAFANDEDEKKVGVDDWLAKAGAGGFDSVKVWMRKAFDAEVARIEALESGGYIPLGQTADEGNSGGQYCVFSIEKNATIYVKPGELTNPGHLIHVCGKKYLKAQYPKKTKEGEITFDATEAGGDLAERCNAAGWWDDSRKRGTGVWPLDASAVLVNSSAGLWATDGRPVHRVTPGKRGEVYVSARDLDVTPKTEPATASEAKQVLDAAMSWNWDNPDEVHLAVGWVAAAYYCGALDHRPMMYLTGECGAGKTEFLKLAKNLLGRFSLNKLDGTTLTEPGLRRKLGRMSLATVLDEVEATDNPERLTAVIAYLRASYDGETGTKGSATHGGIDEFTMRTMTALAAISPLRLNDAEQSRFVRIHMQPRRLDAPIHELVATPTDALAFGERLAARMLQSWPRFRAALEIAKKELTISSSIPSTGVERYRNTLGTVVAAGWVLLNDGEPTVAALREYVSFVDVSAQRERIVETRSDASPLEWLLDKIVPIDINGRNCRPTVRELVVLAGDEVGSRLRPNSDALGRFGLRVAISERGVRSLLVDPKRGELISLFETQSRWSVQDLEHVFKTQVPTCERKRESKTWTIGKKDLKPLAMGLQGLVSASDERDDEPAPARGELVQSVELAYAPTH